MVWGLTTSDGVERPLFCYRAVLKIGGEEDPFGNGSEGGWPVRFTGGPDFPRSLLGIDPASYSNDEKIQL